MHIIKLIRHTRNYCEFMTICGTNVTVTMTQHQSPLGRDILKTETVPFNAPLAVGTGTLKQWVSRSPAEARGKAKARCAGFHTALTAYHIAKLTWLFPGFVLPFPQNAKSAREKAERKN